MFQHIIFQFSCEVKDNPPPNSPNLMVSDFYLVMKRLDGEQFVTDTYVKQTSWLKTLYNDFF
jgi:hypothetical protein